MNRNCYRLRLHARTAQWVPVAEIHSARGRAPAGLGRSTRRRAHAALALALATITPLAQSGQPAANGVPIYDIAPADAQGLSHNRYPALQVPAPGAVFNNSLEDGRSQLAGHIAKNPHLAPGTQASTILAEVQASGAASRLAGALEVFGPEAALIVANPNGIYANGLATINVSRLSLMGAASQSDARGLRLRTGSGTVEIGPAGVNTDGLSAFDLIAQHVRLLALSAPATPPRKCPQVCASTPAPILGTRPVILSGHWPTARQRRRSAVRPWVPCTGNTSPW